MNRLLPSAAVGIALVLAAGCGGDAPTSTPVTPKDPAVEMPEAEQVLDVPVTRPATVQPVDVNQLPAKARAVSRMPGLNPDEKACANYAIKTTVDGDKSIESANGKMASVLGNAIVACTSPERLGEVVSAGMAPEGQALTDEQRSCLQKTISADTRGAARFLSALLTLNVTSVATEAQHYDDACQVDIVPN